MRSVGKIPEFIALISSVAPHGYGDESSRLAYFPVNSGRRTKVFPIYSESDRARLLQQSRDNQTVDIIRNTPFGGIRLVDRIWDRGRGFYNVKALDDRIFSVEDHVVMDSAMHESVSHGVISGSFIWVDVPYMDMQPVRIGSVAYNAVLASHQLKTARPLAAKDLVPGDILQTGSFKTSIYLGAFSTKKAVLSDIGTGLDFTDDKIRLYFNPTNWSLMNPRKAISSIAEYEQDFNNWCSVTSPSFEYRFNFNNSGFKHRAGRVELSCHFRKTLSERALAVLGSHLNGIKADAYRSPERKRSQMLGLLAKYSWLIHLSDISKKPELMPIYSAFEFFL